MSKYRSMRQRKKLDARAAMVRHVDWELTMLDTLIRFVNVTLPRFVERFRRWAADEMPVFIEQASAWVRKLEEQQRAATTETRAVIGQGRIGSPYPVGFDGLERPAHYSESSTLSGAGVDE